LGVEFKAEIEKNRQLETTYFSSQLSAFSISAFLHPAFAFSHATARGRSRRVAGRLNGS
jgi:hypothetical protein